MLGESIGEVLSVGLHAGSGTALFGSADCLAWVWNLNGERSRVLRGHTATVTSVALSPNGQIALTGSLDGTVRVWDAGKGMSLRVLRGHTKGVICVAFCPDGHSALTSGADATIRLWDIETGKQLRLFEDRQARSLAVSPDGLFALVTSGTGNRTEIPLGNDQGSFMGLVLQTGHDEMIDTLHLTDPRTPAQPPLVHPEDTEDPYREFAKLYDSVGLRVIREGPNMGEIELA